MTPEERHAHIEATHVRNLDQLRREIPPAQFRRYIALCQADRMIATMHPGEPGYQAWLTRWRYLRGIDDITGKPLGLACRKHGVPGLLPDTVAESIPQVIP